MNAVLDNIFASFTGQKIIHRGLEREALRISSKGYLSKKKHPTALGSSLTNKYITTDYSEALLELVTPTFDDVEELYIWNQELHKFCAQNIDGEFLWPLSMPCVLEGAHQIPIAEFGTSNAGMMKHLYRVGLSNRYGSAMQVIAGIHYNFSLSDSFWDCYWRETRGELSLQDFKSEKYMALIRNFMRIGWVIPYLFGASPAVCKSFLHDDIEKYPYLKQKEKKLIYGEYATSLRMSDLGYRNFEQDTLDIKYNNLHQYIHGLIQAVQTPCPKWQEIGVKDGDQFKQLNDSILQIENEYYGMMRPKQVARSGEAPSAALFARGIQYVEMRSVDINPFDPCGLSVSQMRLLDLILVSCLRQEDIPLNDNDEKELHNNFNQVVLRGRDPNLLLSRQGRTIALKDWGELVIELLRDSAKYFEDQSYAQTIDLFAPQFKNPELTLSARLADELESQCYCKLGMGLAEKYDSVFNREQTLKHLFEEEAANSHILMQELELFDHEKQVSFSDYLDKYYRDARRCLSDNALSIHQNQATR